MREFENVRVLATGLQFPEGPVVLSDGSILLAEIRRGTLTRVTPEGKIEVVAEPGGGPNGCAIGPDGKAYVCNNGGFEWSDPMGFAIPGHQPHDYSGGRIERVALDTGAVEVLYTECDGHLLKGPNDIVFDNAGGFWFTDHGKTRPRDRDWGGVYYAKADGSRIVEAVHPADTPNGIGLSPEGEWLYYAETRPARVHRRRVTAPGQLADTTPMDRSGVLAGVPGIHLYDSLAVDGDGNVCVACLADPGIMVISPTAGTAELVAPPGELWDPLVTNICFGGEDLRTAFITLSGTGKLIACDWPTAGLRLTYER